MKSIETYLSQVTAQDSESVIDALEHLAAFSDVRALNAIQNAFFHPAQGVRQAAARAAGENGDVSLLDALLSLLDDEDPGVRLAAVRAAGKFVGGPHDEKVVLTCIEHQPEPQTAEAVNAILLRAGPGVVPLLESELTSLDEKRRERAIQVLPFLGDLGVMALITHLPHLNVWESTDSARMLGGLDHPMLVDYFLEMLNDPEVEKRRFAMTAVGNGRTTLKAIHAVGEVLLYDSDQIMRLDAALFLKWSQHPVVLTYLDQFDSKAEKGLYGRWIREIIRDTRILLSLQEQPLMEVLKLLFAGEKYERPLVCVELSRREDPIAIPFLARALLSETSNDTKGHILVSLADLEAVEAVDAILAFFDGSYTNEEEALALRTLGRLYHPKVLPYLKQRASEPILNDIPAEIEPIESARQAVHMVGERLGVMRQAWFTLLEEEPEKRVFIALNLAMRGDNRGVDLLLEHFHTTHHPAVRYQTLRALGECGTALVLPFLLDVLGITDERLAWHALIAIGQLPLEKVPVEVAAMLLDESPVLRMAAMFALGRLSDDSALPSILNRLSDGDSYVRAVAVQTLWELPFDVGWLPVLDKTAVDEDAWVRLETTRLLERERKIPSREALMHLLRDEKQHTRFLATRLAAYYLEEDLRPALEYCASIKGGGARRNARQLIKRLNWQEWSKDPELLARKKKEARQREREKARKKRLRELRRGAREVLKALKAQGWESLLVTAVAGAAYVDAEMLYPPLEAGEQVSLEREPENPHDARAILVLDAKNCKLGYIPQARNKRLAARLDAGELLTAVVLQADLSGRLPQLHIEVLVWRNE